MNTQTPIKSKILKLHEYQPSMTGTFDPNGYDGVVNALDELSSFLQGMVNPNVCKLIMYEDIFMHCP